MQKFITWTLSIKACIPQVWEILWVKIVEMVPIPFILHNNPLTALNALPIFQFCDEFSIEMYKVDLIIKTYSVQLGSS
jgi:hypothetical protein